MEVYYIDLNTSSMDMVQVTDNDENEEHIQTDSSLIAFNLTDSEQVMVYDIAAATAETIWTSTSTGDAYVGVGDGIVAWKAYDGANYYVYYYDTEAAVPTVETLLGADSTSGHPIVVGDAMVWRGAWSSGYPLYYHQVGDPLDSITQVSVNNAGRQPDFDGDFIVWEGYDDDLLWYYDMATATATSVSGTDVEGSARVSGGIASWIQDNDADGDNEVFYCDLNASTIATVKLTDNVLWESRARNDNGMVVFRTGGASNWNWKGMIAAAARW
jgi:hypothetical protein